MLDGTLYGNSYLHWARAAGVASFAFIAVHLVMRVLVRQGKRLTARSHVRFDDVVMGVLEAQDWLLALAAALYAGTRVLALPESVAQGIARIAMVCVLIQAGIWANRVVGALVLRQAGRKSGTDAQQAGTFAVLGFLARLVVWSLLTLMVLANLGFNITALVASLGIGGVAVALAVQNILGDLFSSLSIALDKPFEIGDFIVVGESQGTVEYVGLKSTRLRSLSGEQIILSNTDLLGSRIHNYKRMNERRVEFTVRLVYGTPAAQLAHIPDMLREIVEAQQRARFQRAHFKTYSDFGLAFEVAYYVLAADVESYMDTQQAINLAIAERFEKEGLQFAMPARALLVKDKA